MIGSAINDADYNVNKFSCGSKKTKVWTCPFYRKWYDMLTRCYSESYIKSHPTYAGCFVCDEWLTFSNFKRWMESQDWQGRELDKDLISCGNKIYSPGNCVFVSKELNNFLTHHKRTGSLMTGVKFREKRGVFESECRNPITRKREHVGVFGSELDAHIAWAKRKFEIFLQIALSGSESERVSSIMLKKDKEYFNNI